MGGVRARHPLQGHHPRRARARLRPPVHAGRGSAGAGRSRVLHDPRPVARGYEEPGPEAIDDDPRISPRELAAYLAGQYADAGWSRTDHYAWISGLLLEQGITSLAELTEVLRPIDGETLNERMGYRYPPGAVRRLDDALLAAFGDKYIALHGNSHRVPALQARLAKLLED